MNGRAMSTENIEELQRIFNKAPFIADLGIKPKSIGKGECVTMLVLEKRHMQQDGFVHAGVQATIADHTAGAAAATLIGDGQIVLTAEFKINLLRVAKGEQLVCHSRVLKPGRRFSVVESEVFCHASGRESLVSKAIATIAVVPSRNADQV